MNIFFTETLASAQKKLKAIKNTSLKSQQRKVASKSKIALSDVPSLTEPAAFKNKSVKSVKNSNLKRKSNDDLPQSSSEESKSDVSDSEFDDIENEESELQGEYIFYLYKLKFLVKIMYLTYNSIADEEVNDDESENLPKKKQLPKEKERRVCKI